MPEAVRYMQVGNVRFVVPTDLDAENVRRLREEWPDGEIVPPVSTGGEHRSGWLVVVAAAILVTVLLVVVAIVVHRVDTTVPQRSPSSPGVKELRAKVGERVDRCSFVERGGR